MISKEKKAEIIAAYGRTPEDTGSLSLPLIFRRTRRIIIPEEVC